MGAGDCPKDTQEHLLGQVLKLNLGFSDVQLRKAIRHLIKIMQEFGSSEEALAWIPQDNFTILVNYILDNDVHVECPNPRSPVGSKENKTLGSLPAANAQEADKGIEEGMKGGKPTMKVAVKKDAPLNGYVSDGNAPLKIAQPHGKIEKRNNTLSPQRSFVDRNELRNHYKKKLCTGFIAKSSNQKTKEKGEAETHCSVQRPYSAQKNARALDLKDDNKLSLEARPLIPSGCNDLATGSESIQVVKKRNGDGTIIQNRRIVAALDNQVLVETSRHQSGGIKAALDGSSATAVKEKPHSFVDSKGVEETPAGTSSRFQSANTGRIVKEKQPFILEKTSLDRQKHTTSVQDGCSVKGEQDRGSCDGNSSLLVQLEAFLKEGNCQMALQTLKALKLRSQQVDTWHVKGKDLEGREVDVVADIPGKKRGFVVSYDISRGLERLPISCVNEYNSTILPENFLYVKKSVIRQAAHVDVSFSRIGDLHCCCSDCVRSSEACKCTDSTRGEYAYDRNGQLIERLASGFQSGCNTTEGDFITECCDKCRCSMSCGNRIVQRGITRRLQVFMTPTKKGWGVRALEKIPARSFVCEYLGEIATNAEQYDRNLEYEKNGVYTYTMALDADFDMERSHFQEGLSDHEALVLDATIFGNVSRFVNHRCNDANLFMRPVQIETRDTHYYHAAFFAVRDIEEMEELTWDYGIDFQDATHQVKAFRCYCKSSFCRDKQSGIGNNKERLKKGKTVKGSDSKRKGGQNDRRRIME